jgi:hypothetical protein
LEEDLARRFRAALSGRLPGSTPLGGGLLARVDAFGLALRFVLASSSSSPSSIPSTIEREAPRNFDFDVSPRFALSAAPAAFFCALDLASMGSHLFRTKDETVVAVARFRYSPIISRPIRKRRISLVPAPIS